MRLAIDPSVNDVGYCLKVGDEWDIGCINTAKCHDLMSKVTYIVHSIYNIIKKYGVIEDLQELIFEYPTFMVSIKGQIAAQKGYTIDLGFVIGYITAALKIPEHRVVFYKPIQWKGSVPKRVTDAKFKRLFNCSHRTTDHEVDATMMLYYHLNERKK